MERGCILFKCLRRRYYCCADCRKRDICRNPCQNTPEKCGLARETMTNKIKEAEHETQ